ncbi:MAG: hypothetical protein LBH43_04130, partial [Treponema sp.]|nr:hypothetical protein [Treponema sp.]
AADALVPLNRAIYLERGNALSVSALHAVWLRLDFYFEASRWEKSVFWGDFGVRQPPLGGIKRGPFTHLRWVRLRFKEPVSGWGCL